MQNVSCECFQHIICHVKMGVYHKLTAARYDTAYLRIPLVLLV